MKDKTENLICEYEQFVFNELSKRDDMTMYTIYEKFVDLPFSHMQDAFVLSLIRSLIELHDKMNS